MSVTLKIQTNKNGAPAGDIDISEANGRPLLVSDRQKLGQDIVCNLETDVRANGVGAGISSLVGTVPRDYYSMSIMFSNQIKSSFDTIIALQKATSSTRTALEMLSSATVSNMSVDSNDPRVFIYKLNITSVAGRALQINGAINGLGA
jgi:hypothetical protein